MKIKIISLGKFKKNPPLNEIFEYYKKRISLELDLVELKTYDIEKSKKLFFINYVKRMQKTANDLGWEVINYILNVDVDKVPPFKKEQYALVIFSRVVSAGPRDTDINSSGFS